MTLALSISEERYGSRAFRQPLTSPPQMRQDKIIQTLDLLFTAEGAKKPFRDVVGSSYNLLACKKRVFDPSNCL